MDGTRFRSVAVLYNLLINDAFLTSGTYQALFAHDTCIYHHDCKERHVIRNLQPYLSSMKTWRERWNIKINEDMGQAIYFSRGN
jgi:hypothetical protein